MRTALLCCVLFTSGLLAAETNAVPQGYLFLTDGSSWGVTFPDQKGLALEGVAPFEMLSFTNQSGTLVVQFKRGGPSQQTDAPPQLIAETRLGRIDFPLEKITHFGPLPAKQRAPSHRKQPKPPTKHVVKDGERLHDIAARYEISVTELLRANKDLSNQAPLPGVTIRLPKNR